MPAFRNDWIAKSLAGTLLGFALAVAISGLFAWVGPGGIAAVNKYQMIMWLVVPLWLGILGACFLFRDGLRAWIWLGGACALVYAGLFIGRHLAR